MRHRNYRFPCEHTVVVDHRGERLPAQLINISAEGARLSGLEGLSKGDVMRVELGAGCPALEADVRWTRGTLAGLRFDQALSPRLLALIRRSVGSGPGGLAAGWNLQLRELR